MFFMIRIADGLKELAVAWQSPDILGRAGILPIKTLWGFQQWVGRKDFFHGDHVFPSIPEIVEIGE